MWSNNFQVSPVQPWFTPDQGRLVLIIVIGILVVGLRARRIDIISRTHGKGRARRVRRFRIWFRTTAT